MQPRNDISGREEAKEAHVSPVRYIVVLVILLVLAAISWGMAHLPLGAWSTPLAVGIAGVKALLVILFFMHLWEHQGANRLVLGVAFFFVALMIFLDVADLHTRLPITNSPQSRPAQQYYGPVPLPPEGREPTLFPPQQPHAD